MIKRPVSVFAIVLLGLFAVSCAQKSSPPSPSPSDMLVGKWFFNGIFIQDSGKMSFTSDPNFIENFALELKKVANFLGLNDLSDEDYLDYAKKSYLASNNSLIDIKKIGHFLTLDAYAWDGSKHILRSHQKLQILKESSAGKADGETAWTVSLGTDNMTLMFKKMPDGHLYLPWGVHPYKDQRGTILFLYSKEDGFM